MNRAPINPTVHDNAVAIVAAFLSFKPAARAEELHRAGWGNPTTIERSRGYTRAKGLKRAPACVTVSDLYTCPVHRDYLLEAGIIKLNRNGAMRLVSRDAAEKWVTAMVIEHDMLTRHGDALRWILPYSVRAAVREDSADKGAA